MSDMLNRWSEQLPQNLVTRFAPSPGGWLHLGHVLSAMYVWGLGKVLGAHIILRIEDHDLTRARPTYEQGILEDLHWLGLQPDEGVESVNKPSSHRQSDHLDEFEKAIAPLIEGGLVYGCDCTRKQIKDRTLADPNHDAGDQNELYYDGHCRGRRLSLAGDVGLRLKIDNGTYHFVDGNVGNQTQTPARQCGDWLLKDRNGHFTYNAAVVIDDLRDNVNLVIRGADLLHASGRQLQLRQLLRPSAADIFYFHHPLIFAGEEKLSKRNGSLGIRALRAAGLAPSDVWQKAASAVGLPPLSGLADITAYFEARLE